MQIKTTRRYQITHIQFNSVQLLSCVQLIVTPQTASLQVSLSITNSWSLLKLMSIESVIPSNHLILCNPLLLPPSIFPAPGSFQMSQLFVSGGQSTGVAASKSVILITCSMLSVMGIVRCTYSLNIY